MDPREEIKAKIDIVQFISEYTPLKKTGRNFKACCPFHQEKTPSFIVSPDRQSWHCFGSCQTGGDIFTFLMKVENIDFAESLKILAARAGVTLPSFKPSVQSDLRDRIYKINEMAAAYYQYILTKHPVGEIARKYLEGRRIGSGAIETFKIGYAPDSWESLLTFLRKKGFSDIDIDKAGLLSMGGSKKYFDRFRGRVMFPLSDHRGEIVGFAGRLLDPLAKEAKYINTAETAVYIKGNNLYGLNISKEEIRKKQVAVVVEGEIDLIQSWQAGVKNVVAIKGTAFTESQVNLLKRYADDVVLSLDADTAGDSAMHRGIMIADNAGLSIKVVQVPKGKDPDECIRSGSDGPRLWKDAVEKAVPFYDYVISTALQSNDPQTAEGKKKIVAEVAKFLGIIDNEVVKAHYLKKLAQSLRLDEPSIAVQIEKELKKTQISVVNRVDKPVEVEEPVVRKSRLEDFLLAIFLQSDNPADWVVFVKDKLAPADLSSQARQRIYETLLNWNGRFHINDFANKLGPEMAAIIDKLYLWDLGVDLANLELVANEINRVVWDLKELELREKLAQVAIEIKKDPESELFVKQHQELAENLQKLVKDRKMVNE